MAKTVITKTMIRQRIVANLIKNKVYVTRLGKKIIPQNENDLPPRMKRASIKGIGNPEYKKAHAQLYYEINTKPERVKSTVKSVKKTKVEPVTIIESKKLDEPMKEYRKIARTGQVDAKKLVINMSSTMTCTIIDSGLITVDFT